MSPLLLRLLQLARLQPKPATPEQIEAARMQMRQAAITDGVSWRVDHLPAVQILDDLAEWNAEFPADHGT